MNEAIKLAKVRLHKGNGETFEGSPYECAIKLMSQAIHNAMRAGNDIKAQWEFWSVQDFCRQFGLSAKTIAWDCGIRNPERIGIYE